MNLKLQTRNKKTKTRPQINYSGKYEPILKVLRIGLITMCAMSTIAGIILCSIGIWILGNKSKIMSMLNLIDAVDLDKYKKDIEQIMEKYDVISRVSLAFVVIGFIIFMVSAIGIYGTVKNLRQLLLAYAIILGVLLLSIIIMLIILVVSKNRIQAEMSEKMFLLQNNYSISLLSLNNNTDTMTGLVTEALNYMQVHLKCCGVKNVGDARNSASWRASERRIVKLMEERVLLGTKGEKNTRNPIDEKTENLTILDTSSNSDVPDWLKFDVPAHIIRDQSVPKELPKGYLVDENLFEEIVDALTIGTTDVPVEKRVAQLFDDYLTLRTPVTCCQLHRIKYRLKGGLKLKLMYDNLREMSCVLEARNFGVNKVTCLKALWDTMMSYVAPFLVLTSILIISLATTIASAVAIIMLENGLEVAPSH